MKSSTELGTRPRVIGVGALGVLLVVAAAWIGATPVGAQPPSAVLANSDEQQTVSVTIPVGAYEITQTAQGHEITIEGFGRQPVAGEPKLPSKIFTVAIPPEAEVVDVGYETGEGIVLPGVYNVSPTPMARVIGQEDPVAYAKALKRYEANHTAVYDSNEAYPGSVVEFVRSAGYRKHNLVDVRVTPLVYRPLAGQVAYYPEITVHVNYRLAQRSGDAIVDNLERTERIARDLIVNYAQAEQWYPRGATTSRGLHDFVIITLDSLTGSVTPLVNWETSKGRTVEVVTTTWINANYDGGYDLASDMRAFLRDKYPSGEWGIEDVLLVGHYDDVPMRRTEQDLGYGKPETDFYFAELSLSDGDSWDDDGDHLYGEDSDSLDYYGEVNVGRIPYSDAATVQSICEKSVAYEQNESPAFKKNILLLGAFFWNDDPNPRTDNAELMEAKVDQTWMSDWTMTRMYEQGYSTFAMDYNLTYTNVRTVWSSGTYAFVNWAGHGSPTSSHIYFGTGEAFVSNSTCSYLNDDYPAIIFADACSNHDTDYDNLGWAMMGQGGVGYVGSTKVALGCPGWDSAYDGSSQSMDYFFTIDVTSGDYTQGQAHQRALTTMYTYGLWSYLKYETFEWGALLGNPNLGMASVTPPTLTINLPDGAPDVLAPGVATSFNVEIIDGIETYVPGTGMLHYRYDGGTYLTDALTPLGGDLYQATLPAAGCADTPEFYISAEGHLGTVVFSPVDAPSTVYTAIVGTTTTFMDDDFESDLGWTVGDVGDDATTGIWDRADPEYTEAQPEDDHTPSPGTDCYVTDHRAGGGLGDYDVDGGKTTLMSPIIDLSGVTDATISYYRWYSNDTGGAPNADVFEVDISNNGGGGWTNVETVGPSGAGTSGGWIYHEFDVADFVTPTADVKLRFIASDEDTGSLVEAALDDFLVTAFACEDVPTCEDGILNQGEDKIDCGGPCPACNCLVDGDCLFCNGETCDAYGECQPGDYPCEPEEWCDEENDVCVSLPPCAAEDVNCDGTTDSLDLGVVKNPANWLLAVASAADPRTDVNGDELVDSLDLGAIKNPTYWLSSTGDCQCPE